GVTPVFSFNTQAVNRGYSEVALQLALVGNALLGKEDAQVLRHVLDEKFSNVTHPPPVLLTPAARERLLVALAASNTALHRLVDGEGLSPYLPAEPTSAAHFPSEPRVRALAFPHRGAPVPTEES